MTTATTCPLSGTDTGIVREIDPELGSLSVDELETLARNEWRRRLGKNAYHRCHSRDFVRALVVFALAPESPVRALVVERLLWRELSVWGAFGLNRQDIRRELRHLSEAIRDVLATQTQDGHRALSLADRIDARLRELVAWPPYRGSASASMASQRGAMRW
ncbi:MAG: hypothetical protein GTN78_24370 [Gemmatimonadales bacterium]|nr:hypothetical protein [Gemmatimonadales bacterium]NIN12063.1 hypothetical protein [Gemmatimonadales bacterium]NIR03298.1 hypothetical protein [Gemmatimonadales bacterium]NIS66978.1 hypothetical protein [Gemmatimonadales bacterium]